MKRVFPIFLLVLCGCSVVSYDRVFPKLAFYWSADAKAQRADRAQLREWQRTNTVNQTK